MNGTFHVMCTVHMGSPTKKNLGVFSDCGSPFLFPMGGGLYLPSTLSRCFSLRDLCRSQLCWMKSGRNAVRASCSVSCVSVCWRTDMAVVASTAESPYACTGSCEQTLKPSLTPGTTLWFYNKKSKQLKCRRGRSKLTFLCSCGQAVVL